MSFFVRAVSYNQSQMLNICDADLMGKSLTRDDLQISIDSECYGQQLVGADEAKDLLARAEIINMVGDEVILLATGMGIGSVNGIKTVEGVPFLIVFKM